MKRVYTDERCPGYAVTNDGSRIMEVCLRGKVITTFETWDGPAGTVSEAVAQRRAEEFFNRSAQQHVGEATEAFRDLTGGDDSEIFSAPASPRQDSQLIDRLIAREATETDPVMKDRLRRNIMRLMQREESLASSVVNQLLA